MLFEVIFWTIYLKIDAEIIIHDLSVLRINHIAQKKMKMTKKTISKIY